MNNLKKKILAWSLYDFASSPFSTLIITFIFGPFFISDIVCNEELGTVMWTRMISISTVIVALLSPYLGAFADTYHYRKKFLIFSTLICIVFNFLLFFSDSNFILETLFFIAISNIGCELGYVFYNSFLKDISNKNNIGKISGNAWALGYIGGLLSLFICLIINIKLGDYYKNIPYEKIIIILVSTWFLIFSIPSFLFLKENYNLKAKIKNPYSNLLFTFRNLKKYKNILYFLIARLLYNDALITIFALGGVYASVTLGFNTKELIILAVVLNIFAALGSFLFGFIDDKIGSLLVIKISLYFLLLATCLTFISSLFNDIALQRIIFWISAILSGLFAGPNQSASRSYMTKLTPKEKLNEFFGFYSFSGKSTSFLGPLLFGELAIIFGTQRAGLVIVFLLFLSGLLVLSSLNKKT